MKTYSEQEREEIVRAYFASHEEGEDPRCPECGELLEIESDYTSISASPVLEGHCPDCHRTFSWTQTQAEQPWKELHLRYFLERFKADRPLRCPFDDCSVIAVDFEDGVLEFRCPYCNHRGRVRG